MWLCLICLHLGKFRDACLPDLESSCSVYSGDQISHFWAWFLHCQDSELSYFYILCPEIALEHLFQLPDCQTLLSLKNCWHKYRCFSVSCSQAGPWKKYRCTKHQRFTLADQSVDVFLLELQSENSWACPSGFRVCGIFSLSLIRFQEELCDTRWVSSATVPPKGKQY